MRTLLLAAVVAALSMSGVAQAQTPAGRIDEKKVVTYNELERGLFFEARGGFFAVINPPALAGSKSFFSPGQAIGIDLGFDLGERVSPSLFFLASANRMPGEYTGLSTTRAASGDFGAIIPGAAVKVRLVGLKDAQEVDRTWFYVRAGGGVVFYNPTSLLPKMDVLVTAGPGLEYFTRLRHFVIGVEANFNFMVLTQAIGFSVMPTVKYTF